VTGPEQIFLLTLALVVEDQQESLHLPLESWIFLVGVGFHVIVRAL
jgi:hypothetical protein